MLFLFMKKYKFFYFSAVLSYENGTVFRFHFFKIDNTYIYINIFLIFILFDFLYIYITFIIFENFCYTYIYVQK